jgi:hypothetical protein
MAEAGEGTRRGRGQGGGGDEAGEGTRRVGGAEAGVGGVDEVGGVLSETGRGRLGGQSIARPTRLGLPREEWRALSHGEGLVASGGACPLALGQGGAAGPVGSGGARPSAFQAEVLSCGVFSIIYVESMYIYNM